MKAIALKKLLSKKKLTAIFSAIETLIPDPVCIMDNDGTVLYGDPSAPCQGELQLLLKNEPVGLVKGGAGLQEVTNLLHIQLNTEYEKKSLATETLSTYNELTMLYQVAREFSVSMTLEQVAQLFVQYARKNVWLDTISVMLFNPETDYLEVLYAEGDYSSYRLYLRPGQGIAGVVFEIGESQIVNDVTTDSRFVEGPVKISSMICTPLKTGKKVIGVINLSSREPYQYTARDLDLVYTLASQAASAIENAKLYVDLQKSEHEYRSLYENAVEGIFRCTETNRLVSINPSMSTILGYSSTTDLLESITDFAKDSFVEREQFMELTRMLNRNNRVSGFETQLYKKDKSIIWVSINAVITRKDKGEIRHIDGTIVEITERIKREKAEREKELLQHQSDEYRQLLHVLCHDLANPLANLKGFLGMINNDASLYDKFQEYLMLSVDNGLSIIDFVRKISAIKESKFQLNLQRQNLKTLIDESGIILFQQFKNKEIQLNNNTDPDHFVLVDKTSFVNSVINNLLSNAVKFSFPGSSIEVDSVMDNENVVFTVSDHGVGIPPRILESIFDSTKKTNREGTNGEVGVGFGMPLVKTFITAYGGTITVESIEKKSDALNHGTRIRVELKSV